jgi:guanylate kinase
MSEIRKGMLLVISGPSGTGKGTLIEKLREQIQNAV